MPQLAMWATHHPVSLTLTYQYDPRDPLGDATIAAIIKDQGGGVMAHSGSRVGGPHLDEWVHDWFAAAWLSYLYGSPEDLQGAVSAVSKAWRSQAAVLAGLD